MFFSCFLLPLLFFFQLFLPSLLRFSAGLVLSEDAPSRHSGLEVLVQLILSKAPPPTDGSMAFETYPLLFTGLNAGSGIKIQLFYGFYFCVHVVILMTLTHLFSWTLLNSRNPGQTSGTTPQQASVPELVLSLINLPEEQKEPITDLSLPWSALILLPHLRYDHIKSH